MNEQDLFDFLQYDIQPEVYDGVPWYVAADVCRILGLKNPAVAVSRLDDGDVMLKPHMTAGGAQKCLMLTQAGLFALLLASKKPIAKEFQRYVRGMVMPSVMMEGAYIASFRAKLLAR